MQGKGKGSSYSFLKKYYGENISNLFKIREKRANLTTQQRSTSETMRRVARPASETRLLTRKAPHFAVENSSQKMLKKLSHKLEEIKESIAILSESRRKPVKSRARAITEASAMEDPKQQVYKQVLNQIKQMKEGKSQRREEVEGSTEQRNLFYGVDYIDGIQFKIKIKLGRDIYCLLAKNAHTKLMLELSAKEYMRLQEKYLNSNPCNILKYLSIENNLIKLKLANQREDFKSLRSYLSYC